MAQVKDPVCGMMIEQSSAAGTSRYQGETYYFCSTECLREFEASPAKYVGGVKADRGVGRDREARP
jgi:YHS domain-containing protein